MSSTLMGMLNTVFVAVECVALPRIVITPMFMPSNLVGLLKLPKLSSWLLLKHQTLMH